MRSPLLATLALCFLHTAAHASPVYNLTLTGSPFNGTGSVTLATAPSSTGLSTYTAGQFSNLSFTIDGQTFSAAPGSGSASVVQFLNGSIYDVTFAGQIGTTPNRFALDTTSGFAFYYNNLQSSETGTITSSLAPMAATPEPASLLLLSTGLLGVGGLLRRRFA